MSDVNALPPVTLSPEQLREFVEAQKAISYIRRAAGVAAASGWTMAIFAAITLALGYSTISGVAMGIALGAAAVIELRARSRFKRLDGSAARTLAANQLAVAALIVLYAAWSLHLELSGKSGSLKSSMLATDPDAAQLLQSDPNLIRQLTLLIYAALVSTVVCVQGLMAWYYFSRGKIVRDYVARTPLWILQLQRA